MMRSIAAGGVVLVAAMFAWTATAGGPPGPAQDRVYGGGFVPAGACTDGSSTFCTLGDREFSVLAVSNPDGGGAYGTVTFANSLVRVTCLAVHGNTAVIGGVVLENANPAFVGGAYTLFVRDSGTPGASARDGISVNFFDLPPVAPSCDVAPDGFGYGYLSVSRGDLAVVNR